MTKAIDDVGNSRQLYIINSMNVSKHLQFVQKTVKVPNIVLEISYNKLTCIQ